MIPVNSIPIELNLITEVDDIDDYSFYVGKAIKGSDTSDSVDPQNDTSQGTVTSYTHVTNSGYVFLCSKRYNTERNSAPR